MIRQNSFKAWILATRPKTLTCASVPVMVALALAYSDLSTENQVFQWLPALLCMAFAFIMQIDANLINDYFDFVKGVDGADRLGPQRACAQGWITPQAMITGIAFTTLLGSVTGLPLIWYGGKEMIGVGAACILFSFLYTTTLSRKGLGDLLVLVFFGLVPVCVTYYIQTQTFNWEIFCLSLAVGLVTDTLLLVNNYRDRDTDKGCGKTTLVVLIGTKKTEWLYLYVGVFACLLCLPLCLHHPTGSLLPFLFLFPHIQTWKELKQIHAGRALNQTLGKTARNIFIFGLLLTLGIII